ncbi:MAG: hypothetical protein IJ643_11720 [Eubacterium sp.]|nr:hypothetical protein [Eubacterium sp.]MBR1761913.1 hypothetical protein [Eubacterium sp.]
MLKEQYLLSIAHFMYESGKKVAPELKRVFSELPEDMKLPAIYFPDPEVLSFPGTLSSDRLNYNWFVKVIAISTETAYEIAAQIQRDVCGQYSLIPILNQDGTETGNYIRLEKPQIKKIDRHTYQLAIGWNENLVYYDVDKSALGNIQHIDFEVSRKGD